MSPALPAVIAEIAEVAGMDAAWALARKMGGLTVFIPAKAPRGHWLVELVGREAADKICAHYRALSSAGRFNGVELLIPMAVAAQTAQRWSEVLASDMSAPEMAKAMRVHERTAWRHRASWTGKEEDRKDDLFGVPPDTCQGG